MAEMKWNNPALAEELVPKKKGASAFNVPDSLDDLIFMAKLAEQTDRYDDMVVCMRMVVKLNPELSTEARSLSLLPTGISSTADARPGASCLPLRPVRRRRALVTTLQ